MKKLLLLLSFLSICLLTFSQDHQVNPLKKDTVKGKIPAGKKVIAAKKDTIPPLSIIPREKAYVLMLSENEIQRLYSIVRTSGKLTGTEIEDYLILLDQRKKEIKQ